MVVETFDYLGPYNSVMILHSRKDTFCICSRGYSTS